MLLLLVPHSRVRFRPAATGMTAFKPSFVLKYVQQDVAVLSLDEGLREEEQH